MHNALKKLANKLSERFGGTMQDKGPQVSTGQLLRIADAVPAAVTVYNIHTAQYIYANKAATAVMGYEPEEFISGGLAFVVSLVHPDDVQELLAKNEEALDMANILMAEVDEPIASFVYRMLHKDGKYRWVKTDGTVFGRSSDGGVELILNITVDISAQKQTEIRLRHGLKQMEQMLDEGGLVQERDM
jgi:PAS domain S-box-containing protein